MSCLYGVSALYGTKKKEKKFSKIRFQTVLDGGYEKHSRKKGTKNNITL